MFNSVIAILIVCLLVYVEGIKENNLTTYLPFMKFLNNPIAMDQYELLLKRLKRTNYELGSCSQHNGLSNKDSTPQMCPQDYPLTRSRIQEVCDCFCKKNTNGRRQGFPKPCTKFCGISKLVCLGCRNDVKCKQVRSNNLFQKRRKVKTKKIKYNFEKHLPYIQSLNDPKALELYYILLDQMKRENFKSGNCNQRNMVWNTDGSRQFCPNSYPVTFGDQKDACDCFCKLIQRKNQKKRYPKKCYRFCGISKLVCLECRQIQKCKIATKTEQHT